MFVICQHLAWGERGSSLHLGHHSITKESWYPHQHGSSCGPEKEISAWHQGQINVFSSICVWQDLVAVTQHSSLFMILVPWTTALGNLYSGPFEICVLINRGNNWVEGLSYPRTRADPLTLMCSVRQYFLVVCLSEQRSDGFLLPSADLTELE